MPAPPAVGHNPKARTPPHSAKPPPELSPSGTTPAPPKLNKNSKGSGPRSSLDAIFNYGKMLPESISSQPAAGANPPASAPPADAFNYAARALTDALQPAAPARAHTQARRTAKGAYLIPPRPKIKMASEGTTQAAFVFGAPSPEKIMGDLRALPVADPGTVSMSDEAPT